MTYRNSKTFFLITVFALSILIPAISFGQTFSGDTSKNTEGLGNYTGGLSYQFSSPTSAELVVTLTNTSSPSNGGFLTGFVFNNPNNFITNVVLSSSNSFFQLLGAPSFSGSISASPFSNFDIGAAVGGSFLGTGSPYNGIGVGQSANFSFGLTGSNLNQLNTSSFIQAKSSEGDFFISRFRGFNNGGSDKVPGATTAVPEFENMFLLVFGLIGFTVPFKLKKKS